MMKITSLICAVLFCFAFEAQADAYDQEVTEIHTKEQLQKHIENMTEHNSPLLHLSHAGRDEFVEGIMWTDSGIASFSFFPLELELTEQETYRVLQLFGLEAFTSHLNHLKKTRREHTSGDDFLADMYALRNLISSVEADEDAINSGADVIEQQYNEFIQRQVNSIEALTGNQLHQLRKVLSTGFNTRLSHQYAAYYEDTLYAENARAPEYHLEHLLYFFWNERDFERFFAFANTFNLSDSVKDNYLIESEGNIEVGNKYRETMILNDGALTAVSRSSLFNEDFHVVVVSSPGCGFSQTLYSDFNKGAQSHPELSTHFSWFISQHSGARPAELLSLQETYPSINFDIVVFDHEWSEDLNLLQYPLIYVVSGGEINLALTGWTAQNSIAELIELFPAHKANENR